MSVLVQGALYGGNFATKDGGPHPFVLPGELIEINGEGVVKLITVAPERAAPACAHFSACGGCQYQHAEYSEQIRLKVEILKRLFQDAGLPDLPLLEVHSGEPWGYRNRVRMRVQLNSAGEDRGLVEIGYSRRGTNEFLPIRMCPIAAPILWKAAEAIRELGERDALCARWMARVNEFELFCTGDQRRLQMQLFLGNPDVLLKKEPGFAEFCQRVRSAVPELVGAGAMLNPSLVRRLRKASDGAEWGATGLSYEAAGKMYWISRGAFFQVNRFLVDKLVELVTSGQRGGLAWDLYAGVGLFSRILAERFERVVAVEGGEAAAADLARASRAKTESKFESRRAPILEFLRAGVVQRERPELVVLDPPRAGIGVEGSELLSQIGPAEIIYVSCDPNTLARDLAVLTRQGYYLRRIDLVDLFPQTFHMETLVALRRA